MYHNDLAYLKEEKRKPIHHDKKGQKGSNFSFARLNV